jgi:hypothetical protein
MPEAAGPVRRVSLDYGHRASRNEQVRRWTNRQNQHRHSRVKAGELSKRSGRKGVHANPDGLPIEVFDGFRNQLAANRAQFYG